MAILGGQVDAALIGADRVTANGDAANKIGSLGVALASDAAKIPFLVIAPESTVDRDTKSGSEIHIEMRKDEEVTHLAGVPIAPLGTRTFNPAFDVTPHKYISALVTEKRVYDYKFWSTSMIPKELSQLVERSKTLGADQSLVLYGGGNTSSKGRITDYLGRLREVMWVKGSGADMMFGEASDYPALYLEELLALEKLIHSMMT
ncbi:MAG: hypothetical protein WDO06_00680 [Actinomycetota bacterium]